jgi:hypothetical protein
MRVPARFSRNSVFLWVCAALVALALAWWELAHRRERQSRSPVSGQDVQDVEILEGGALPSGLERRR